MTSSLMNGVNHDFKVVNVQKAAAPENGVEFCQVSNGTIRGSLATSYNVTDFYQSEVEK